MPVGAETATATVVAAALGGKGYTHCGQLVLEYSSLLPVALTGIAADVGNGSYGFPTITLPATGGKITKYWTRPLANKWKLLQLQFVSADPALQVYLDGCICFGKSWGSEDAYHEIQIFGVEGGGG